MKIVYYSHGNTTYRFVEKLKEQLPKETEYIRLKAKGPHTPLDNPPLLEPGEDVALFTPTYGRFDFRKNKTVDFTPRAVADFLSKNKEINLASIVLGNLTFGGDAFAAKREIPNVVAEVELSGDNKKAKEVSVILSQLFLNK